MIEPLLKSQLEPVARRHRRLLLWRGLAVCWASAALAGGGLILLQRATGWASSLAMPLLGLLAVVAAIMVWRRASKWQPDYRNVARQIESQHPQLHALLLTAVEQQPDPKTGKLNFLQERVIREAIAANQKYQWIDTVSGSRLFGMQCAQLATLVLLVAALMGLRVTEKQVALERLEKLAQSNINVTPGDTQVERGSGMVVLARFAGPLPLGVNLVTSSSANTNRNIPLVKSLDDPMFGGSIPEVTEDFVYHVEFGGQRTRDFKVSVFEHPRLERADAQLTFPEYTGLPEKRINDTRRVSAVEGSRLELSLQLNKPMAAAKLVAKDKSIVPLLTDTNKANATLKDFTLDASKNYELQLVDAEGRTNKVPAQFVIDVLKNRAPELKIASPRGDQKVSPLEEIQFQAEAWDDFGLRAYGLAYTLAGKETKFLELGQTATANEKRQFNYLLPLEDLGVQPDQLISYFLWADDTGPDGKVRRTSSDMFFAEVRPFEEIFRQGQPQEGQSEQERPQSEVTKLAELQKQIINATWKLQRQETGKAPSAQYKKDAPVVRDSQQQALDQAGQLKENAQDPRAQAALDTVEKEMKMALAHLTDATNSPAPLPLALGNEQSAYQALLKLQAREYLVSQNRGKGNAAGQSRSQQQLDQLEMKEKENRYETQSQAASPQNAEQREQLAVLNRLKELAQRQQDLNERLKELQSALQEAKTDAEREEIRRRLKRLREEEQEMLADVDELKQRMDKPENQSRMADARQQLEKTRGDVQNAAEALEKESVSQALNAGTRAQRELQDLRDDFRKQNASQFAEDMKQMRTEARDLAKKQEDVGKKIDELAESKRKTLSDSDEKKELTSQLKQQKDRLTNLVDHATQVTQQAETAEPLLSKQLYDTLRKSSQANIENSLDMSTELLRQSFLPQAGEVEQRARKGIGDLKQGIERAAESVLGDEAEALRLARQELDDLTQQINKEITASDPAARQQNSQQSSSPDGKSPSQQGKNGQQTPGQNSGEQQGQQSSSQNGEQPGQSDQASNQQSKSDQNAQGQGGKQPGQGEQASKQPGGNQPGKSDQDGNQQNQSDQNAQGQGGKQPGQSDQARNQQNQQDQKGEGQGQGQGQQGKGQQGQGQEGQGQQGQGQQAQGQGQGQGRGEGQGQQAQNALKHPGQGQGGNQPGQGQGNQPGNQQQQAQQNTPPQQARGAGKGKPNRNARPQPALTQQNNAPENRNSGAAGNSGGETGLQKQKGLGGLLEPGGDANEPRPLTGQDYSQWAERLRDVEEMVDLPELRNQIANVRERAKDMRAEYKRHGKEPQWPLVKSQISDPLAEVRSRISEELARRESKEALVPIDRDPVPTKFSELVRRYYEKLGSEK